MGEVAKSAGNVVVETSSNLVGQAVVAVMKVASVVTGNPELAVWAESAGTFIAALTGEAARLAARSWLDRPERVARFLDVAAKETGGTIEDVLAMASDGDRKTRRLLGVTVQAGAC